jgi:hypothetical protein
MPWVRLKHTQGRIAQRHEDAQEVGALPDESSIAPRTGDLYRDAKCSIWLINPTALRVHWSVTAFAYTAFGFHVAYDHVKSRMPFLPRKACLISNNGAPSEWMFSRKWRRVKGILTRKIGMYRCPDQVMNPGHLNGVERSSFGR